MASSSSRSGVHIQVTAGRPFTSSQTGTSSTAASADIRPLRFGGWIRSGESGAVGIERRVLQDAYALERHAGGQSRGNPGKEMRRDRFAGRQRPPVGELGEIEVEMPAV